MPTDKTAFSQLPLRASFRFKGQLYRKRAFASAELLRWATGTVPDQPVTHKFFPETHVELTDEAPAD